MSQLLKLRVVWPRAQGPVLLATVLCFGSSGQLLCSSNGVSAKGAAWPARQGHSPWPTATPGCELDGGPGPSKELSRDAAAQAVARAPPRYRLATTREASAAHHHWRQRPSAFPCRARSRVRRRCESEGRVVGSGLGQPCSSSANSCGPAASRPRTAARVLPMLRAACRVAWTSPSG